jgi:hypothetical protein
MKNYEAFSEVLKTNTHFFCEDIDDNTIKKCIVENYTQ